MHKEEKACHLFMYLSISSLLEDLQMPTDMHKDLS